MDALLVSPIVIPLAGFVACLLAWRSVRAQRAISLACSAGAVAATSALLWHVQAGEVFATRIGGWDAPFGITIAADILSAIMALLGAVVGLATVVYSLGSVDERRERYGYHALLQALLAGVAGAFLSADLFNIYVWFEVLLMSSFVLLTLGGERGQLEGAIKYVTLNLLSSTLFLSATGLVYGMTGTLNLAHLAERLGEVDNPAMVTAVSVLFFTAFGIKAAVFPFFFWLPASYHTPPGAVSAVFAGLLTKVGVYAMIRVFTLVFVREPNITGEIVLWVAGLTMASGVLGAAVQTDVRRILSFHIISQIGYMLMGLGVALVAGAEAARLESVGGDEALVATLRGAAALSMAGSVFYIFHHIIVKTNLFFVAGVVLALRGTGELSRFGGLYKERPWLGVWFLVSALSLAGIPALSGFWAKFTLVRGGLEAREWWIVAVSIAVSLLTLYSMTKIWAEGFWAADPRERSGSAPVEEPSRGRMALMYGPIAGMAIITIVIGAGAGAAFGIAERAAAQLLDNSAYRDAVLGRALAASELISDAGENAP
ncbi:MAG: proton-conducting transporter transmembrane domain-containing protein [Phycisphaerales bacterium]